jgi:hypothetical protein
MVFSQRSSLHLLRLFAGRMFHGNGELGADDLDLGMSVVLIFLAMPGVLASLLMFEKFGSLIRFLRGDGVFDPYVATIPDEYFFIVLSMAVSCAVALWRCGGGTHFSGPPRLREPRAPSHLADQDFFRESVRHLRSDGPTHHRGERSFFRSVSNRGRGFAGIFL